MTTLQFLIGLIIDKIEKVHDYIQIVFSDGTILSIFNNYIYHGNSVLSIKGKTIRSIEESSSSIILLFENGDSLSIGLNDEDYNGPEAMVLNQEGKSPLVWN